MAESRIKSRHLKTVISKTKITGTINANSGKAMTVTVAPQAGYQLVSHLACWQVGIAGLTASFDSGNPNSSLSVPVYALNVTNSDKAAPTSYDAYVYVSSLFVSN